MKRLMDLVLTGVGLIVLCPLFLILSIFVKLTSPGPVFFRQIRIGKNRKEFKVIKFRSMRVDAEKTGPHFTSQDDKRITPFGKFLRTSKLDELPGLWNVFVGDMSLVGPRPMVPKHIENYKPEWERVFSIRPGITDLATLRFRNEESILNGRTNTECFYRETLMPQKMKLILEYVDNHSVLLDLKILFLTVWHISFGRLFAKSNSLNDIEGFELEPEGQTTNNDIQLESLFDREVMSRISIPDGKTFSNRTILVSGATGSIGCELCNHLLNYNPKKVILLDNTDQLLVDLKLNLNEINSGGTEIISIYGNVTNKDFVNATFVKHFPEIVFHLPKLNHDNLVEEERKSAIRSDFLGTKIIADAANLFRTNSFIMASDVKAVNPTSLFGMTLRMAELLMLSLNKTTSTNYITTRLGHVWDSNEGISYSFNEQISKGGPLTIPHEDKKRYLMTKLEAVHLLLNSSMFGKGGEIFVNNIVKLNDMLDTAKMFIEHSERESDREVLVTYSGLHSDEKLEDELMYEFEDAVALDQSKISKLLSPEIDSEFVADQINELIANNDIEKIFDSAYQSLVSDSTWKHQQRNKKYRFHAVGSHRS